MNEDTDLIKPRSSSSLVDIYDISFSDLKREALELLWLCGPAMVAQSSFILMNLTDSIFIGQLGVDELAAVALGSSFYYCIVYLGVGLAFGLDTILSQAFGANKLKAVGIYLQTSVYVVTAGVIPVCATLWYTETILLALKQEPNICALAGVYNRWLLIGIWPYGMYYILMKFLQCQKIMLPSMIFGIIAIILNIPLNMIFIWGFKMGLVGAAIGTSIARWLQALMLFVYVAYTGIYKESNPRLYKESLSPYVIWEYLKLAVPATLMLAMEVIGFSSLTLLIGLFQNTYFIDAHASAFNVLVCVFIVPYGWGTAVTVHVGNLLGSEEPKRAFTTVFAAIFSIASFELFLALLIWSLRYQLIQIWSHGDVHLENIGADVISFVALAQILDGVNFVLGSVIRGIGRQLFGTVLGFVTFYLIMFPVGLLLAYNARLKIFGYWYGLSIALVVSIIIGSIYMLTIDWVKEVELASSRTEVGDIDDDEIILEVSSKEIFEQ